MIASGHNVFSAMDCPANAYGVSSKMYGLTAAPCKPCPRNMITDGVERVTDSDACINPDGFGYASEGGWLIPVLLLYKPRSNGHLLCLQNSGRLYLGRSPCDMSAHTSLI